jgi:chorismate mutase
VNPASRSLSPRSGWLVFALVAVLASGCATTASFTSDDTARVDRLLGLIGERLDVAPEVARTKWNTRAPIDDPLREERVLETAVKAATEYGLDPHVAKAFFRGQIEASKVVQRALHAEWTDGSQSAFANVADLGVEIRPVLDRLTPAMLRALVEALPVLERRGGRRLLQAQLRELLARIPVVPLAQVAPMAQLTQIAPAVRAREAAVSAAVAPLLELSR